MHLAEESDALLRGYAANLRVFGDVIYDAEIDPVTKQQVIQWAVPNYQNIVAISAQRGATSPISVFDSNALNRLDISRQQLLANRNTDFTSGDPSRALQVRMETIKDGVELAMSPTVNIPAPDNTER